MTMRLFVGIALPQALLESATRAQELLRERVGERQGVRYVDPAKFHITIQFLGNLDESVVPGLIEALSQVRCSTILLTSGELSGFPGPERPRVIFQSCKSEGLHDLAEEVQMRCLETLNSLDLAEFHPHITLARVSPASKAVGGRLRSIQSDERSTERIDAFQLFHSTATGEYVQVHQFPLRG